MVLLYDFTSRIVNQWGGDEEPAGQLKVMHKVGAFWLFCIMCCIYIFEFICDRYAPYFYDLGFQTLGLVSLLM